MKKIVIILTIAVAVLLSVVLFGGNKATFGGDPIMPTTSKATNFTAVVQATSTSILSANNSARIRIISNIGASDVFIGATTTNLVSGKGFWLKGSTTQVFSGDTLYTGVLYATGTEATTTLSIFQL